MGARVLVAKLQHLQRDRVLTLNMIQMLSQGDAYWSTAIPTSRQREYRWVKIGTYKFEGILWDNAISDRRNSAVRVGGGTIERRSLQLFALPRRQKEIGVEDSGTVGATCS